MMSIKDTEKQNVMYQYIAASLMFTDIHWNTYYIKSLNIIRGKVYNVSNG